MNWLKKHASKFRFSFEIAVLLLLAVYVTVQASNLNHANATLANRAFASATRTVPGLLNYQGYLTDSGGAPLDGAYAIKFAIYDALTGGAELWSETQLAVQINDGQLSALLGETEPISPTLFATYPDTFIGVTLGSDPEMTPRQRIHSVPYAMHSEDGVPAGSIIIWDRSDTCPSGYTQVTEFSDRFPVGIGVANGNTIIRSTGGQWDHRHGISSDGNHQHRGIGDSGSSWRSADGPGNKTNKTDHAGSHNHGGNTGRANPPYYTVLFCRKN
jgi:hypothetical protein